MAQKPRNLYKATEFTGLLTGKVQWHHLELHPEDNPHYRSDALPQGVIVATGRGVVYPHHYAQITQEQIFTFSSARSLLADGNLLDFLDAWERIRVLRNHLKPEELGVLEQLKKSREEHFLHHALAQQEPNGEHWYRQVERFMHLFMCKVTFHGPWLPPFMGHGLQRYTFTPYGDKPNPFSRLEHKTGAVYVKGISKVAAYSALYRPDKLEKLRELSRRIPERLTRQQCSYLLFFIPYFVCQQSIHRQTEGRYSTLLDLMAEKYPDQLENLQLVFREH